MRIGDLVEILRRVAEADRDVKDAEQSLFFGGSRATIEAKRDTLYEARSFYDALMDEEIV
jgi:hypothetical protein